MKHLIYIILCLGFHASGNGQIVLKRSVIGGGGGSQSNGSIYLASSVSQPPGTGTLFNGSQYLRQGFQQPHSGNSDAPCGVASFEMIEENDPCGTSYNFIYSGNLTSDMTILWDFGVNGIPRFSNEPFPDNIKFAQSGTQQIKVEINLNTECSTAASAFLNAEESGFTVQSEVSHIQCYEGEKGSINLTPINGLPPYQFQWGNGSTLEDLDNLSAGNYSVTVTDARGCQIERHLKTEGPILPLMLMNANVKDESCRDKSDGEIEINAKGGTKPYIYMWSNGETGEKLNNLPSGDYGLTLTDANGCELIAAFPLEIYCEKGDFIFNVFTPNDDGDNDTWVIEGIEHFPDNEVQIFNRWGSLVFNTKAYTNDWRGTSNSGELLTAGAYYYIVNLNDEEDTVFNGAVTILR